MVIERPESKQPIPDNATRVFRGVIFDVYQWQQKMFDGSTATFEKLKRADTVMIIPMTEDGKIIMAEQKQPGKPPFTSSIGGRADEYEDPLDAAKRELLEEAGHEAAEWILWDAIQPVTKIDWAVFTFIAKGCRKVAEQQLDGGEKIALKYISFDAFVQFVLDGGFGDLELKARILEAKLDPQKMAELQKLLSIAV